jgi:hypothetical protein
VKTFPTAVAIATALVVGVASGASIVGVPTIQAPHTCTVAFNLADRIVIAQANSREVVYLRATRGQSEFDKHDADLTAIWDELDDLEPAYAEAKAACLGEDS